eukprot:9469159-Pyramimonas_sp.AAC.1
MQLTGRPHAAGLGLSRGVRSKEEEEDGGRGEQKGQRPPGCLSESVRMSRGSFLKASWGVLGASWRSRELLGPSWVPRGASWRPLWGPPGRFLWPSWGSLGAVLGALEGLLGPSWRASVDRR